MSDLFIYEREAMACMGYQEQRAYHYNTMAYMRNRDWKQGDSPHVLPEVEQAFNDCKTEADVHEVRRKYNIKYQHNGLYLQLQQAAFDRVRKKQKEGVKMGKDLKQLSKGSYTVDAQTAENIQVSALMRIADATELMAQNYVRLQNDLASEIRWRKRLQEENRQLANTIRGLRGAITKMKNKAN